MEGEPRAPGEELVSMTGGKRWHSCSFFWGRFPGCWCRDWVHFVWGLTVIDAFIFNAFTVVTEHCIQSPQGLQLSPYEYEPA